MSSTPFSVSPITITITLTTTYLSIYITFLDIQGGGTREESTGSAVSALSTQTMQTEMTNLLGLKELHEHKELKEQELRGTEGTSDYCADGSDQGGSERLSDGLTSEGGSAKSATGMDDSGGIESSSSPSAEDKERGNTHTHDSDEGMVPEFPEEGDSPSNCTLLAL